jgi:aminodeoxyfutalosine deaminase
MNVLATRKIPLEICLTSNLRTNALNIQLNSAHCRIAHHPLAKFFRRGIPITLSTDDPAMFHTTLLEEFSSAMEAGLSFSDLLAVNRTAFEYAFLPQATRQDFLARLTPPTARC